jgi:hypothetical protein
MTSYFSVFPAGVVLTPEEIRKLHVLLAFQDKNEREYRALLSKMNRLH